MKLLLFDIDGTLIRTAGSGKRAMERSFEKVYGIEDGFHDIEMMGRTDPSILMEALKNHNLEWREEETEQFQKYYFQFLEEEIEVPRPGKHICPGVDSLLKTLRDQSNLVLGLLTGNWRRSAFLKLHHFGIDVYFSIGAFADDSYRREDLVPVVIERFKKNRGIEVTRENVYIIGDTPLDIRCAKPHGVRTVGVATGFHNLEELVLEEPDYLLQNFQRTEEVLKIFR